LSTTPVAQWSGIKAKHPGGIFSLSANGTAAGTGIVWASLGTTGDAWHDIAGGMLVAVDATSGAKLWDSDASPADRLGNFAKFSVPVVANGKVYVTTFAQVNASSPAYLRVYGLK
jgi:outer membrane protein assembly factor BamB